MRTGQLELPVGMELTRAALGEAAEAHPTMSVRRAGPDVVDVVAPARERRGEEKLRFTVHSAPRGTSIVEHGAWGLRGVGSAEQHQAAVDDLAERLRAGVARALLAETPGATAAYVGTVVGGERLRIETGRCVAVVFGPQGLSLSHGHDRHDLPAAELLEVEAVPLNTPAMPWDRPLLTRLAARAAVGTVIGLATGAGVEALVHVTGSTTSVVNAELAPLRAPARPAPVAAGGNLVREMATLAQRHRDGVLDEEQFALAKATLLGTERG